MIETGLKDNNEPDKSYDKTYNRPILLRRWLFAVRKKHENAYPTLLTVTVSLLIVTLIQNLKSTNSKCKRRYDATVGTYLGGCWRHSSCSLLGDSTLAWRHEVAATMQSFYPPPRVNERMDVLACSSNGLRPIKREKLEAGLVLLNWGCYLIRYCRGGWVLPRNFLKV